VTPRELGMDEKIQMCIKNMRRRGFDARYAENKEAARKMILDMIPQHWIVGCGDSATVRSISVLQDLQDRGHYVLNPFIWVKVMREHPQKLPLSLMKLTAQGCDVFLSSTNAATLDGRLVNSDGGGMRVTGQVFGPHISVIVFGRNKIVKDVEEGLWRIKNIIAPIHSRSNRKDQPPESLLPIDPARCLAELEKEYPERWVAERWAGPDKISGGNITVILEGRPMGVEIEIVPILVNEDLGLGWDPAWPQERKDKIFLEYQKFTPPHRPTLD